MKLHFTDAEHRAHCRIAKCLHPAVHTAIRCQGWCARCRAVAFGLVYEGLAYINGKVVHVGKTADTA